MIVALHRLLHDSEPRVRAAAVSALGRVSAQQQQKVAALQPLLQDQHPIVRQSVVQTLGHIEGSQVVITLMNQQLSQEQDPETLVMTRRVVDRLDLSMKQNGCR